MLPNMLFIILALVLVFLAFKFFKSVVSAAMTAILLLAVLFAIFSYSLYQDINDITSALPEAKKTFLLLDNETVITGFWAYDTLVPINKSGLGTYEEMVEGANLTNRFFIFRKEIFENSSTVMLDSRNFTRSELLSIIYADSASEELARMLKTSRQIIESQYSENDLKAKIFGYLVDDLLDDNKEMTREFKKGNVILMPQGPSFMALKLLPDFVTEKVFKIAFDIKEV